MTRHIDVWYNKYIENEADFQLKSLRFVHTQFNPCFGEVYDGYEKEVSGLLGCFVSGWRACLRCIQLCFGLPFLQKVLRPRSWKATNQRAGKFEWGDHPQSFEAITLNTKGNCCGN